MESHIKPCPRQESPFVLFLATLLSSRREPSGQTGTPNHTLS